jgi:hypothetical protein
MDWQKREILRIYDNPLARGGRSSASAEKAGSHHYAHV